MILADDLLESVKRAISVPASQPLLTDAGILAICDEVIGGRIVPLLESLDENFFVTSTTTALVGGQLRYDIPYRAAGRNLRDLLYVDSSGNKRSLPKIELADAHMMTTGDPAGFYFEGDQIRLVPDVPSSTSGSLEIWWRMPPSKLVTESSAGTVSSVSYGVSTDTVTLVSAPSWAASGVDVDFIQARSGSRIRAYDKEITNVAGTQLSFTAGDVPTDLANGDYIAQAGYSPVLNSIPNECLSLIRSLASYRICSAIGDFDALKIIREDIRQEETDIKSLLQPRIDGEPDVLINRRSLVRGNKWSQRRWLGPF